MKHIIISGLFLVMLLALSVFVFDPTHLYYELPWLDIPMHILGGFGVASLTAAILTYRGKKVSLMSLFIAYSIVAVSWELYEYAKDFMTRDKWNGWYDTSKDLFDGALGVVVLYWFSKGSSQQADEVSDTRTRYTRT